MTVDADRNRLIGRVREFENQLIVHMNTLNFCLTILAIGVLFGCNQGNREIIIKGGFIGDIPEDIRYTVPVSGNCFWGFRETIRPDSSGNFSINANIDKPSFIGLFGFGNPIHYLIVEPGRQYDVRINLSSEGEKILINGNTSKINKLYNTFPNHEHPQFDELWSLFNSSPTVIRETLNERKNQELSQINELYQSGEISIEVFNLVSQDRLLYNMNVLGFLAFVNVLQQLREGHEMIDNEYMMLWHEANSSVPLSDKYFFSTIQAFQFLGNILWYNLYSTVAFTEAVETQSEFVNKGLRHTRNIELSRKYLDPDVAEYYQAAYIFFNSYQKKYEKEFIPIMQQFTEDFPNSKYLSFISPFIDDVVAFHENAEINFTENIRILENYSEINSFEQAISNFKGKRIYLDIWATWCGPCKAEFQYTEELKELLTSEAIEMFYISTDRDNDDEQWKNMIKYYNLEGYHIRANEILKAELRELLNMRGIPHFVLVDEDGQVLIQDAKRPSQLAELEKQIREN